MKELKKAALSLSLYYFVSTATVRQGSDKVQPFSVKTKQLYLLPSWPADY